MLPMNRSVRLAPVVATLVLLSSAPSWAAQSWPDRAHAAVVEWFRGPQGVTVAQAIQRITHPTGSDANLANLDVRHVGESLSVRLTVTWVGGLGTAHSTIVAWDFDRRGHRSAAVLSDDAITNVSEKSARRLDTYFRDSLYPALRDSVGN